MAAAGMASILLMNYSLRANSIGSYQILKVAVLPTTMALSYFQRISTPSTQEIAAASLVIVGTAVCTVTDMSLSLGGLLIGVLAVLATSQYQIFQVRAAAVVRAWVVCECVRGGATAVVRAFLAARCRAPSKSSTT
ncbi:hypothetical protein EON67_04305 [archaeon]|nr:MAG: hypothetical protein EON67_04305 [archaeon]